MDSKKRAKNAARRASLGGLFIALAFVLSWIEFIFPLQAPIPGVKLGLANLVTLFALYKLKLTDTVVISLARVILAGLVFGGLFPTLYALSGWALSLSVMLILKKSAKFSPVAVSVAGGVFHNVGQLICAAFAMSEVRTVYYLPVLLISGIISGAIVGTLGALLLSAMKKMKF